MSQVVVITGASSGIGRALALRYARDQATLGLIGRNAERLAETAELCGASAAGVYTATIDVRDQALLGQWLTDFDRRFPVDLVIANAGVSDSAHAENAGNVAAMQVETNLLGVLNSVHPLLPRMSERGRGQLALMSSIAAFMPLRDSAAYGATKAAILYYGVALGDRLHGSGVHVSVICPGFVTSPMSARTLGWKPFEMSAEKAADIIHYGLTRRKPVIVFPRTLGLLSRTGAILPHSWRRFFSAPFGSTVDKQTEERR